jgi:hypothetical protein
MKQLFLITLCAIFTLTSFAQNIYKAISGEITFFSEAPMENIEAKNTQVKAIMNTEKNEIAFIVPVIGFKFEKPLMEEHFNENYMESEKFKTAQFSGTYSGDVNFKKDGTYAVKGKGKINIHGVEQEREFSGEMNVEGKKTTLTCKFNVKLEDHKIEIPKMVMKKIAEEVEVSVNVIFEPK